MDPADKTLVDQIHILLDVPSGQNISFNLLGGITSDQETENSAMLKSAYYARHK